MKEQWTFVLAVAIATMLLTSGCVGTNDYILAEMGLQTFDKPCVAKNGVNGDFGIDESINCCIEAATHLGFWYDASKSISSKFSFEARWKGSIVYYGVTIFRVGPRTLHFDYVAGCGGDVYGDGGNVKIWKLFLGEVHRARKNRERLSNSVGQSTVNNPVEKESDSTIPQVPDTSGLQNLSGTTWLGKDSEGEFLELRFKDQGLLSFPWVDVGFSG